jgi:cytochrome P450
MVQNPEVLAKAHAEIDEVVGREHPPNFKDLENLPYIQAMVKETLRWGPVGPLGMCSFLPGLMQCKLTTHLRSTTHGHRGRLLVAQV